MPIESIYCNNRNTSDPLVVAAITCPACQSLKTGSNNAVKRNDGTTRRTHRCRDCGHSWKTFLPSHIKMSIAVSSRIRREGLTEMVCSTCRLTLPVSEYGLTHREGGRGYRSSCKKCLNEKRADRQLRDACEQNGITLDDYQEILKRQGGVCAICRTSDCGPVARRFSIDHCHKTGKVRGLLCHRCNLGIGHFDDSIELLRVAIAYLTEGGG